MVPDYCCLLHDTQRVLLRNPSSRVGARRRVLGSTGGVRCNTRRNNTEAFFTCTYGGIILPWMMDTCIEVGWV